jgi:hypothetical protein
MRNGQRESWRTAPDPGLATKDGAQPMSEPMLIDPMFWLLLAAVCAAGLEVITS